MELNLSIRISFAGSIETRLLGESGGFPASRADDLRLMGEAMLQLLYNYEERSGDARTRI